VLSGYLGLFGVGVRVGFCSSDISIRFTFLLDHCSSYPAKRACVFNCYNSRAGHPIMVEPFVHDRRTEHIMRDLNALIK
jgi:hypothetical protein